MGIPEGMSVGILKTTEAAPGLWNPGWTRNNQYWSLLKAIGDGRGKRSPDISQIQHLNRRLIGSGGWGRCICSGSGSATKAW